jgi:hypothetical protein
MSRRVEPMEHAAGGEETMLRITAFFVALALAFPFVSLAEEKPLDPKAPEAVVVAAAEEDALVLPAPAPRTEVKTRKSSRFTAHGSSQSDAGYRFTNPYAVPQQTLPLTFPALTTFSF